MDKVLILKDGTEHKLSPVAFHEFMRMDDICNRTNNIMKAWERFKEINGYVDITDIVGDLTGANFVIREDNANIHWSHEDEEWQAEYLGFPTDDMWTLNELAYGNLDIGYDSNFVQNEVHKDYIKYDGETSSKGYYFEKTPVLAGTMTGTALYKDEPVQTFAFQQSGLFASTKIKPDVEAWIETMNINVTTGVALATWSKPLRFGEGRIVVSYEYNLEAPAPKYKRYKKKIVKNDVKID